MADHVKVVVYVSAVNARKLRGQGITDVPTWVRQLVKDSIAGMREPPLSEIDPNYAESAE